MWKKIGDFLWAGPVVIVFIALILVFGVALVSVPRVWPWLGIAAVMVAFLIALGQRMSGRPAGILIDSRYKMSLSRFQMVLWTVLVFSAYFIIALPRCLPGGLPDIETAEQVDACIKYLEDQDSDEAKDKAAEIKASKEQDLEELKQKTAGFDALEDKDSEDAKQKAAEIKALKDQYSDETRKKAQEQCTPGQPLNITFPAELVAALGISTASLAGSSLIKNIKGGTKVSSERVEEARKVRTEAEKKLRGDETEGVKGADAELKAADNNLKMMQKEKKRAEEALEGLAGPEREAALKELDRWKRAVEQAEKEHYKALTAWTDASKALEKAEKNLEVLEKAERKGTSLDTNDSPEQATWGDMFRYEVAGKEKVVDLAKVQMFFFTIVVVFAYGAAVFGLLAKEAALTNPLGVDFPAFSSSLNALLGLSHAGYLTVKATEQT